MCDDICHYAGDRSTDTSWYTKRMTLAAIYAATELYMIQDRSPEYEDTWSFMERRFEDLKSITQPANSFASTGQSLANIAYSFYVVGRNAIGANTESKRWN